MAVANPGCAMQIAAGLREIGARVHVAHPVDLIAGGLPYARRPKAPMGSLRLRSRISKGI